MIPENKSAKVCPQIMSRCTPGFIGGGWSSIREHSTTLLFALIHSPFMWFTELHRHSWVQWHRHHHRAHPQRHQPSRQEADGPCAGTQSERPLICWCVVPGQEVQVHSSLCVGFIFSSPTGIICITTVFLSRINGNYKRVILIEMVSASNQTRQGWRWGGEITWEPAL